MKKIFFLLIAIKFFYLNLSYANNDIQPVPINYKKSKIGDPVTNLKSYQFQVPDLFKPSPINVSIVRMYGRNITLPLYLDKKGNLINKEGKHFTIRLNNFGYGEKAEVIVESCLGMPLNNLKRGYLCFVPNPLEAKDDKGHQMTMVCADRQGTIFNVKLSGFQANESLECVSRSCHEQMKFTLTVDECGELEYACLPAVIGKNAGPFAIKLSNENTTLRIQHYWGKIAFTCPLEYPNLKDKFPEFE
jgi:hypothetical protein